MYYCLFTDSDNPQNEQGSNAYISSRHFSFSIARFITHFTLSSLGPGTLLSHLLQFIVGNVDRLQCFSWSSPFFFAVTDQGKFSPSVKNRKVIRYLPRYHNFTHRAQNFKTALVVLVVLVVLSTYLLKFLHCYLNLLGLFK